MAFGQRLDVVNRGPETFIPDLVGAHPPVLLAAIPGGDPIHLYPSRVAAFTLLDRTHDFPRADVFVLAFPTTAVTGLDGKFEIKDIPAGSALVSALLPATGASVSQRVTIAAGETVNLDLTIPFSASRAAPAPAASP